LTVTRVLRKLVESENEKSPGMNKRKRIPEKYSTARSSELLFREIFPPTEGRKKCPKKCPEDMEPENESPEIDPFDSSVWGGKKFRKIAMKLEGDLPQLYFAGVIDLFYRRALQLCVPSAPSANELRLIIASVLNS
jgi:hypothetical protein